MSEYVLNIGVASRMSYKKEELLKLSDHLESLPGFNGGPCCSSFLFIFVMCLVYPMLSVSLDCPFLVVPSFYSKLYLLWNLPITIITVNSIPPLITLSFTYSWYYRKSVGTVSKSHKKFVEIEANKLDTLTNIDMTVHFLCLVQALKVAELSRFYEPKPPLLAKGCRHVECK